MVPWLGTQTVVHECVRICVGSTCVHVMGLAPHPERREPADAPGQVHWSVHSVSFMSTGLHS